MGSPNTIPAVEQFDRRDVAVVRKGDFGRCQQWTVESLLSRIDGETMLSVHRSKEPSLNFVAKNFTYECLSFRDCLARMNDPNETDYWYYRALDFRRKAVHLDPQLAEDVRFPTMPCGAEVHSTVLRLASPRAQVWLHYDVLDNILCQVLGRKRVLLFEPKWAGHCYLDGSSSKLGAAFFEDLEKTLEEFPLFADAWADRYEIELQPGDALAIPAFWCHATQCLEDVGMTCSINTFYVLAPNELNGSDPWANKDPPQAQNAAKLIAKAKALLDQLPLQDQRVFFRAKFQREL